MTAIVVPRFVQTWGGPADARRRRITVIFGSMPQRGNQARLVVRNQEEDGAVCQRSKIWFPASRLRTEMNRTTGDIFTVTEPREF